MSTIRLNNNAFMPEDFIQVPEDRVVLFAGAGGWVIADLGGGPFRGVEDALFALTEHIHGIEDGEEIPIEVFVATRDLTVNGMGSATATELTKVGTLTVERIDNSEIVDAWIDVFTQMEERYEDDPFRLSWWVKGSPCPPDRILVPLAWTPEEAA